MIIESIVLGLTSIVVSSLIFANTQIKRQRQWDLEDSAPEPEPKPAPVLAPFIGICVGTPCPKCSIPARDALITKDTDWNSIVEEARGPRLPTSCPEPDTCDAKNTEHLHMYCNTCNSYWFMETADSKKDDSNDN